MDLSKLTLFGMVKKRMTWLSQRQEVLAQNIANSDTPDFRPSDLKPLEFRDMVRPTETRITMAKTRADHLGGLREKDSGFAEDKHARPFETAPAGNAVVLEEQMGKMNETGISHKLTTELYRKHLNMFRIAIGKG